MCILSFDPKNTRRYLGKSGISHCSHEEIKAPQACVTTKDALARGFSWFPSLGSDASPAAGKDCNDLSVYPAQEHRV